MDLSLFSQNYASVIASVGGDKKKALLKVATDLTNDRTVQLNADLQRAISELEVELRNFYPNLISHYPRLNNLGLRFPLPNPTGTAPTRFIEYDEVLDISDMAENLAEQARKYYEGYYRYGIGNLANVAEVKIPSTPLTPGIGARISVIPQGQNLTDLAVAPELSGQISGSLGETSMRQSSPAALLNQRLKGVEDMVKIVATTARSQGIDPKDANEFINTFSEDIAELRKKSLDIFVEINQTIQREMSYIVTREQIYGIYDARRKKDYYSKVTNTQADSLNPKVYDPLKVLADANTRRASLSRKVDELEQNGISNLNDISKLQEQFVFPRYAIEELKNTGFLSHQTADRIRRENRPLQPGDIVENTTSVLPTAYTPKNRNPAEWITFPASEEIDAVVTQGVADIGAKGKGFNPEAVKIVFTMVETYQKRVLDVDKKRKEIAQILWEKTNGASGAITNDILVEYPIVGQYTIADEIKNYLARTDIDLTERKKMEQLKVDLAKLLAGEIDPLFPEKGPLLPLGNKIREYAHGLGIAEKDDRKGKYGLIFDFAAPGERPEDGQARAAIFDPLVSADAQVFKTIGRQHITDDDKVSNFAFDLNDEEKQIHPKGYLGSLANDELLTIQLEVGGVNRSLRSNSGFVDKVSWRELVNNAADPTVVKKKEEVEQAFRADMYRNYAEKALKDAWRTDFKDRLLAELTGPGGMYAGLTSTEVENIINKGGTNNTRLSEGGNIMGSFTNLDLLADLSLETFSRTYGVQISSMQEIIRNNNRMRGLPGSISDVDPVELFRFVERRFGGSASGISIGGISQGIDENIELAHRYIDGLKHGSQQGYFSPIRTLDDNVINIALNNVGRTMVQATFVPVGNTNRRIDKILPTSNMFIGLEVDPSGVPRVNYKENRLVNFDGEVTPQNIGNVIKVVKQLEAREVPSAHIIRVLGMMTGAQSPEMVKLVNDVLAYDEKTGKFVVKSDVETKGIIGDAQKNSEQVKKNLNNWAMSWMIGTEAADIALKAYRGPLGNKTIRRDILDPEGIVDDVLTKKENFGFGVKLKEDFYNWTVGENPTPWVDWSKAWDPKAKRNEKVWLDRNLMLLDAWKENMPILGAHAQGGVFGHFKRFGTLPGMKIPFVLGNRPLIGDYDENGLKILTDMTGGAPLSPEKWVSTRLQYMIGTRAIIEGKEVNVLGYKILNGWEQGVNNFVNNSWVGKTAQLGKKHQYEKRKGKSVAREVSSIAVDVAIGLIKAGVYKVGQVLLDAPVIGRSLRYVRGLPVVTGTVQNISKTFVALNAASPVARAFTVGTFNSGLVGIPVWYLVGGGIPGVAAGVISGGIWGASKGLAVLAKPETSAAIEKYMGFERLNNIALNEQYLVKIGGSSSDALRTTNLTTGKIVGEKSISNLFATSAYWDDALVRAGGYVRWLSPNGFYGKTLKSVYSYINEVTPEARLFNAYGGESTRLLTTQKVLGSVGRASVAGAVAYALSGGSILLGAGSLLGYAVIENAARKLVPSIAVKLQFLGETATGRTLSNALTKINDFRVHFPLLDTLGLIQSSDFLNQAIIIPTVQMLRGNMPLNVYLFGGTSKMDLWNLSLSEARALGISDRVYFDALHRSASSGYQAFLGGGFSMSSWAEANPSGYASFMNNRMSIEEWGASNPEGYNSYLKSGLSIEEWGKKDSLNYGDYLGEWGKKDPINYKDYVDQKRLYESGKMLKPELEYHYQGLLSAPSLTGMFFYLGAGYIPVVSAYSSAIYTLSQRMGIKNIWGGWYANRFETVAEKSILGWMKSKGGIVKILGNAIDNPFGALPQGLRTGVGYVTRAGGAAAGGYGGYLLAVSLGITSPWGIGAFVAGGALGGYAVTSSIIRGGTYIWNNVVTGWMRVPLAAGGGLLSYASPLIGGAIGGGVASLAGFGTVGYWAAVGVGTLVGAIVIPGIGGFLGVAIGSAAAAGSAYVAGYVGQWVGDWWNKTVGFAVDGIKSISPILALVRVFNSLNRADLGQFVAAIFQFAYSFSLGIAATGVVLTAVVPPLVTPSAPPVAGGTYIAPYNKLVHKQFISYDITSNTLIYQINLNTSVVGISHDQAAIVISDKPRNSSEITFLTDGECSEFNGQFIIDGNKIELADEVFDNARLDKNICLRYSVKPNNALSSYSNFCNEVTGEAVFGEDQFITIYESQCVNSKGQNMGVLSPFSAESKAELLEAPPGQINNEACPAEDGSYVFPVDLNVAAGTQCFEGTPGVGSHANLPGLDFGRQAGKTLAGTSIFAIMDGEVIDVTSGLPNVRNDALGYGNKVIIKHSKFVTRSAHLDAVNVKIGDKVVKGQVIGTVGTSGFSDGPHLHFETRELDNSGHVNPCTILNCKKIIASGKYGGESCFAQNKEELGSAPVCKNNTSHDGSQGGSVNNGELPKPGSIVNCPTSGEIDVPGTTFRSLRTKNRCITPTIIVIHWSGGWNTAEATASTLDARGLACQFAVDHSTTLQLQKFYSNVVEMGYCIGNSQNQNGLNIEITGAYFDDVFNNSSNQYYSKLETTTNKAVELTCWMMKQYNIPINQIWGHYQLLDGKSDPGVKYLEHFKKLVQAKCP